MLKVAQVANFYETPSSRANCDFQLFIDFANEQEKNDFIAKVRTDECRAISVNDNFALIPLRRKEASINEIDQDACDQLLSHLKEKYPDSNKFDKPLQAIVMCKPFDISGETLVIAEDLLTKIQADITREKESREQIATMNAEVQRSANEAIAKLLNLQASIDASAQRITQRINDSNITPAPTQNVTRLQPQLSPRDCARSTRNRGPGRIEEDQYIPEEPNQQNRSILHSIINELISLITRPSQHPVIISAIAAMTAFAAGISAIGMIILGIGIYAAIQIRNQAYSDPLRVLIRKRCLIKEEQLQMIGRRILIVIEISIIGSIR